jgi:integrase
MAKKRDKGPSAIYRRKNGCWSATCQVYTPNGRMRKILYGKTRAEVAAKLAQRMVEARDMRSIKGR